MSIFIFYASDVTDVWYFYTLSESFPCWHPAHCRCNPNRQCCETVARFYVPSEMSPYLGVPEKWWTQTHTHTRTCTDAVWMYMRSEVLVIQTFLAGLAGPEAEVTIGRVKCQWVGLNHSFTNKKQKLDWRLVRRQEIREEDVWIPALLLQTANSQSVVNDPAAWLTFKVSSCWSSFVTKGSCWPSISAVLLTELKIM